MPEPAFSVPGSEARACAQMLLTLDARLQTFRVEMIANGKDPSDVTSEARPGDSDPPTYQSTFDTIEKAIERLREAYAHVWDDVLQVVESAGHR